MDEASDKKHEHSNKSTLDSITSESIEKWNNGSSITGVKGAAEATYRTGDVNITPNDIGLGDVNNTADSEKSVKYAESAGAVAWGNVSGKPSAYTPTSHTHGWDAITGKPSVYTPAAHTHDYIPTSASCNKNWHWSGQGGQPTWLWGGEDGTNMYVYNPSNFTVYRCTGGINKGGNGVGISGDATYFRTYNNSGSPVDNVMRLGSSSGRWKQLYAATTTISTSDRNMKDNIRELTEIHKNFFMKLVPVSFTFKDGESGRTHVGFIAQDVEQAMTECGLTALDFAGFCKDVKVEAYLDERSGEYEERPLLDEEGNEQYIYSLRYEEFIGIITYVLQDNVNEVNSLKKDMDELKNEISDIKSIIGK